MPDIKIYKYLENKKTLKFDKIIFQFKLIFEIPIKIK